MENNQATELIKKVFTSIKEAKTIEAIQKIEDIEELSKSRMDNTIYPKLNLKITKEDLTDLENRDFLKDNNLNLKISGAITDPLAKLLYAMVWKQGDLKKLRHISKGIVEVDKPEDDEAVSKNRKIGTLKKQHKEFIKDYIKWLSSDEINESLKQDKDYQYHIDKVLFATGKAIKLK